MGAPSEQDLASEIQSIISEAVRTDPVLEHFSLRDVKRALVARLGLAESALKEPATKDLVRSTTTRIVERTLAQAPRPSGAADGPDEDGGATQDQQQHAVPASDEEEDGPEDKSDASLTYSPKPQGGEDEDEDEGPPSPAHARLVASDDPPEPESEQSLDDEEDEPPKRGKGSRSKKGDKPGAKAKSKAEAQPAARRRKKSAASPSGPEAEVARLKSFVLACGVRKRWQSYFRDHGAAAPEGEDADGVVLRRQARVLKDLLAELGMTGRMSKEKAQRIKAERELQSELADIGVTLEPASEGADAGTASKDTDEAQEEDQEGGRESRRQQGRKRRALPASSDAEPESEAEENKTPRKRAHVEPPPNETPEIYRQRRAFRRALISDSDEE